MNNVGSHQSSAGETALPPERAWHVVRTNVNCESRAKKGIEALCFEVFMPLEHKWIRHMRKRQRVARPLFARYLFVHFDAGRDHWYPIRFTHGVESLITSERHVPSRVPDGWIEQFRRAEEAGLFDRTREAVAFKTGSRVVVQEGPFAGLVGEILRADGKQRSEILLTFLHRSVPVVVPTTALRAA